MAVIKEDGSLWAWGMNNSGEIGNGGIFNESQIIDNIESHLQTSSAGGNKKDKGTVWA